MLPSSTVENYLKAIYQGQSTLVRDQRLVPMGQVASALGVTPGTATTRVKALAESGLADYEPYSGLQPAGRVEVESRDDAADSVVLRGRDRHITIGARAASKLLVEVERE